MKVAVFRKQQRKSAECVCAFRSGGGQEPSRCVCREEANYIITCRKGKPAGKPNVTNCHKPFDLETGTSLAALMSLLCPK